MSLARGAGVPRGHGPITIYTTSWCGHCHRLKRRLEDAGVPVVEVDVEQEPWHDMRIIAASGGHRIVPTVEVAGELLVNPTVADVVAAAERASFA